VYSVKKKKIDLVASKELFGNIIAEAKAVIGLSGTGNEQAAGMGKPVFSFWGNGPQITKKFLKAQNRLLGGSLFLLPPDPVFIARRMYEVMNSRQTLSKVERNGKMRMAGRGSVRKIARAIDKFASG
jgi:uncharacterized protein (TIGR03492 family)